MSRRYAALCALGLLVSGCGSSAQSSSSAGSSTPATTTAAVAASESPAPARATTEPVPMSTEQLPNGLGRYRDAPWALVGTARGGRALLVYPLTRRPDCGRIRAAVKEPNASLVGVRVFVDYKGCQPAESNDQVVVGPDETTPAEPFAVPLAAPLRGRTVTGDSRVLTSHHVPGRAVDFRGLSLAQAKEVVQALGSKLTVVGSSAGRDVVRQSPKPGSGSTTAPAGGYRVWTG